MIEYLTYSHNKYGTVKAFRMFEKFRLVPETVAKVLGFEDPLNAVEDNCTNFNQEEMMTERDALELALAVDMPNATGPVIWLIFSVLCDINDRRERMALSTKIGKSSQRLDQCEIAEMNMAKLLLHYVNQPNLPAILKKVLIFTALEIQVGIGIISNLFNFETIFLPEELDWLAQFDSDLLDHVNLLFDRCKV